MKRAVILALAVVFVVLALSSVALAATPQDIYNDYNAHHQLQGTYTTAELQAYLGDATLHQYGNQAILTALDGIVNNMVNTGAHTQFPFTGAQITLVALIAFLLVGAGVGIRRVSRTRA
jgi:hypothetical protein